MLEINSTGAVTQVIDHYRVWCDARQLYGQYSAPMLTSAPNGVPCYHYTNIELINNHNNELVVIDCLTEGIHSLEYFKQYNCTNRYLIFTNGTWDQTYYDLGFDYLIMHYSYFLFAMADMYNSPNRLCYFLDKEYQWSSQRPYVFVSTIGNIRPERDYIVNQLMSNLLSYDNFLLRYSGQDVNGIGHQDVIHVLPGEFDPYTALPTENYHTISHTLPINLYNQAHFNLTVESDLNWTHEFLLTEKTIKNLIVGMPFVSVATPHFLKHLHKLGFETYSTVWDESYDDIEDFYQRVDCIIKLCNNLGTLNWDEAKSELIRISQHNRLNFLKLNHVARREFLELERTISTL